MKIAIDSWPINHHQKQGIFNYTDRLISGIASIDKENEYFLLFTSLGRKTRQMPGPAQENFLKIVLPVPDCKFCGKQYLLNNFFIPRVLKQEKCHIFHAPAGYSLPRIKNVKKILTIHDLRSLKIADKTFPQDINSYKKAAWEADICITVSESTKNDVIHYFGIPQEKIKVTYLGVDSIFKPLQENGKLEEIRKKYNLNKRYFFSLGQVPRKNIPRLMRAFSICKYKNDFLLVIGGAGNDGPWTMQYRNLAQELRILDNVRFIGYLPYEDLPLLYCASECFVFPSLYEGFGIPVLEAMMSGVPVITSNISSLPEIGGDAALYSDPYNIEQIAFLMEKIITDSSLRKNLVTKGLERVKKFSWEQMARDTLEIYKKLKG